jgi:hypothetical protein
MQTFMGSTLKFLQCVEFFSLYTLVIGAKLFKELSDKVKSEKNMCPNSQTVATTPRMEGLTPTPVIMVDGVGVDVANQSLVMEK